MKIEPGNRVRVKTAEELGLVATAYRYAYFGGFRMFAAFEDPDCPGLWWLTAEHADVPSGCPWAHVDQERLARPSIGNALRRSLLAQEHAKFKGPINIGSLEVVDVRVPNTVGVNIQQLVDLIITTQRSSEFVHGNLPSPSARETMLRSALEDNIENYLAERGVAFSTEKPHD